MKNIQIIVAILSLAISGSAFGQDNPEIKRIRVSELSFQTGLTGNLTASESFNSLRILAPNSSILKGAPLDNSDFKAFDFNSNFFTTFLMGLSFRNKQKTEYKTRPTLRLGLSYIASNGVSAYSYQESREPFDTLSSAQGGSTIFVDSVISRTYRINYASEQIRFDASMIFRSNQKHRLTAIAGFGISAGASINASTRVSYDKHARTELSYQNGEKIYNYNGNHSKISEQSTNKTNFGYALYIPLGLDLQLGKSHEFWKNVHLFYEYRAGINALSIPELRTYTTATMQHGIGVRVSI
jgi:hypothetical protein